MKNGKHEPMQMVEVEEFEGVFLLDVEDIAVYECPYCKLQRIDFSKNFFFNTNLSICEGTEEQELPKYMYLEDTPF